MLLFKRYDGVRIWLPVVLLSFAGWGAGLVSLSAGETPWRLADADLRLVATVSGPGRYARFVLPAVSTSGRPVADVRAWVDDAARDTRILWRDADRLDVWVDLGDSPAPSRVTIYGLPGEVPAATDTAWFEDAEPVQGTVWRLSGQDPAANWDMMQWAWRRAGRRATRFRLPAFMNVDGSRDEPPSWMPERHRGTLQFLARLQAAFRQLEARRGRFCVQSTRPTVVRLDGQPVAAWPPETLRAGWSLGEAVTVASGIRMLDVFQGCESAIDLTLAIWWDGDEAPTPLGTDQLVRGQEPVRGHLEPIDRLLFPLARAASRRTYRFAGNGTVFRPWDFQDATRSRLGKVASVRWEADPEGRGHGATYRHVFTNAGPHVMTLQVTDSLGFRGSDTLDVTCVLPPEREYLLAAEWHGLPAAAWLEDRVRPRLWVRTTAPDELVLTARFRLTADTGEQKVWTEPLTLSQGDGWLDLPEMRVADWRALRADVMHAGVRVAGIEAACIRPPFALLPDGLDGDALLKGDTQWVMAPRRSAAAPASAWPCIRARRLVWIEDSPIDENPVAVVLARQAFIAVLKARLAPMSLRVEPLEHNDVDFAGAAGIRALPHLRRFAEADVAVLALGESAARAQIPPDRFERQLAVVTGLMLEALGLDLVLATPLPAGEAERLRPYAEAVHGVADAYGLPVLDRYTVVTAGLQTAADTGDFRRSASSMKKLADWAADRFERE